MPSSNTNPPSDTPRTDACEYNAQPGNPMVPNGTFVVSANFSRTLERELNNERTRRIVAETTSDELRPLIDKIVQLRSDLKMCAEALKKLIIIWDIFGPTAQQHYLPDIELRLDQGRHIIETVRIQAILNEK